MTDFNTENLTADNAGVNQMQGFRLLVAREAAPFMTVSALQPKIILYAKPCASSIAEPAGGEATWPSSTRTSSWTRCGSRGVCRAKRGEKHPQG